MPRRRDGQDAPRALAVIGQSKIAAAWLAGFAEVGERCAQVLLDKEDLGIPERRLATGNTLEMLLAQGVIPVIIENEAAMSPDVVCDTGIALAVSVAELLKTGLPGEGD
ncbi:Glutamate 5-kinase [compost metagenome]